MLRERDLEHADEVAEHTVDGVLVLCLDAELAVEMPLGALHRRHHRAFG
jgi:hypothetical protein